MKNHIRALLAAVLPVLLLITAIPSIADTEPVVSAADTFQETAVIRKKLIPLKTELETKSYQYGSSGNFNWNEVSPVSDFFDQNGTYTIAYADENTVYISHIGKNLVIADTIEIAKPLPLIGGVCCSTDGKFYIACGQDDEKRDHSVMTFAIYQYDSAGRFLGKCEDRDSLNPEEDWATSRPFSSGNCAMAFRGNILICSYGRGMYNGHQSNKVFCVDTTTMERNRDYGSYTSHSFNQAVLVTNILDEGAVVFADHGDAYPRGFHININREPIQYEYCQGQVPFHFYGDIGDNHTNARLTGIGELESGIVLVGSSAKSLTAAEKNEKQQMFLQILDFDTVEPILSASSRTGGSKTEDAESKSEAYTDKGIVWLTNYKSAEARASAMVPIAKDKVLVMWEKWDKNGKFVNSYYSILSSTGKILKKAVPMQHARLNGAEELKYQDGFVYWVYSDGMTPYAELYQMDVTKTSKDNILEAVVTMTGSTAYTGKAVKPSVIVIYEGKKLKKGTDYTVSYTNNKKIGFGQIKVKGKGRYHGTLVREFVLAPAVKGFTGSYTKGTTGTTGTLKLSWKKAAGATGYELLVLDSFFGPPQSKSSEGFPVYSKQIGKTKTSYSEKLPQNKNSTYYIRPYTDVNGQRIYGDWSDYVYTYLLH